MSKLKSALSWRTLATLVGVILFALLVWFFGPVLGVGDTRPFESGLVRAIIIGVVFLVWLAFTIRAALKPGQENEKMIAAMTEAAADGDAGAAAEAETMRERMREALEQLRGARLGGGKSGREYLYQLPWYAIIGPPGAGKTTALMNAGLKFPLADKAGGAAIGGVGGTRNCDWWFTDDAVLLDTAGRYTTQDSDAAVDESGWRSFLKLLKKHRPLQPLNGAIVAISLPEMTGMDDAGRTRLAETVRARLKELRDELDIALPVYVTFTKVDLIAGFSEFYDDLNREEREQVLGFTLPLEGDARTVETAIMEEFDALVERMNARLIDRLHQERDLQRRTALYAFPGQIAALRQSIAEFVQTVFAPDKYTRLPVFRGAYFTSGTQDGTPVDRLMSAMARTFGVQRAAMPGLSATGRSYFLSTLLKDVIFGEANLVGSNPKAQRRSRMMRLAVSGLAALACIGAVVALTLSYLGNDALISEQQAAADAYEALIEGEALTEYAETDLQRIIVPLQTLRDLPRGYHNADAPTPDGLGFGLYQGEKLEAGAVNAYERGLNKMMLPRLVVRLEDQLRDRAASTDFLYEALKVYLMMTNNAERFDRATVETWWRVDWRLRYPGERSAELRAALEDHLDALLSQPLETVTPDAQLIGETRAALRAFPLADRVYALIKASAEAKAAPEWTLAGATGALGARVFVVKSEAAASVPGLFTYDGFQDAFIPLVDDAVQTIAEEGWVVRDDNTSGLGDSAVDRLKADVIGLYFNDYAKAWDAVLDNVSLIPFRSSGHATEVLNILSAPDSPLRRFVRSVAEETELTREREAGAAEAGIASGAAEAARIAAENVASRASRLAQIVSASRAAAGAAAADEGKLGDVIARRYQGLHEVAFGQGSGSAPIEQVIDDLAALSREAGGGSVALAPGGASEAASRLRARADALPGALSAIVTDAVAATAGVKAGSLRERVNAEYQSNVRPFCRQVASRRYPIAAGADIGVPLDDFARLFGPGGVMEQFFNAHLAPFVDTSGRTWSWRSVDGVDLGISDAALTQFRRAARIRDAYFARGGTPSVNFEVRLQSRSAPDMPALLEVDGQTAGVVDGNQPFVRMRWPGDLGSGARVDLGPGASVSEDGPWALFRLLDRGGVERAGGPDRFTARFSAGGRSAVYEFRASSIVNPFTSGDAARFRCPERL